MCGTAASPQQPALLAEGDSGKFVLEHPHPLDRFAPARQMGHPLDACCCDAMPAACGLRLAVAAVAATAAATTHAAAGRRSTPLCCSSLETTHTPGLGGHGSAPGVGG
jgi:hypothetical protein